MNDSDSRLRALTVELASSAPMAPPMPDLEASPTRTGWRGPRLAVVVAVVAIVVPLLGATLWAALISSDRTSVATSHAALFETTGATPVAIVATDGVVLRGYLWPGGTHGVILSQGFGSDSTEIIRLATAANGEGATVLLFESRGQGDSEGSADPEMLVPDFRSAVNDLATRGVESVTIAAFSHAATAAIILATEPMPEIEDVIAIFPFEQYQDLNALDVIGDVKIPLDLIGVGFPSPSGPSVVALAQEAPPPLTTVEMFTFGGDDISLLEAHMDRLVEIIRERSR
jgi:hypothetical protein